MAEGRFLFNLDYTQFNEFRSQNNLSKLQQEFDERSVTLSRSLLIFEETTGNYWLLVDFENGKAYSIRKENDTMVGISEAPNMEKYFNLRDGPGPILKRIQNGIGTQAGIIDALRRLYFAEFDIEYYSRSDLSDQKLSLESVYPEFRDVYEMLRDILNSSRESLIGLSYNDVEQIKSHVIQFYDLTIEIGNFDVESENIRKDRNTVAEKISQFRDTLKQVLLQASAYLSSRTIEELKDELKNTIANAEEKFNKAIGEEVDKLQKIGEGINEQQTEVLQKSEEKLKEIEQTHLEYQNQLTEKPISQYKEIFSGQAKNHGINAWIWLVVTGGLALVFSWIFWGLLTDFMPTANQTDQLSTILPNLFAKGFFLSLIFLLLNRTIKNFAAEKHLEVINTHRQNALETFDTFVAAAEGNRDTRDQVLLAATRAIFDANQSGYLSAKTSSSDTASPIQHFIKEVSPSKSSTDSN